MEISDSDQNSNAITEQQRIQQLAKLNLNVDESVTANNSDENNKTIDNKTKLLNSEISTEEKNTIAQKNYQSAANDNTPGSSDLEVPVKSHSIQNKDVPNEVIENIADEISNGVVEDFSKQMATYVSEVYKFDQQCAREDDTWAGTPDKESASSNSETNENVEDKTNSDNVEQSDQEEESVHQEETGQGEITPTNADNIKENDVKDECLENNKKDKDGKKDEDEDNDGYLDLLGNGLLKRKVLEGEDVDDVKPYHGEMVTINTTGRLEDGTVVDSCTDLTFAVGEGDVIQAWDLGVMTTKVGQTVELITDARYAYGEIGREPDIPPNATITYSIKLLKKEESPDLQKLNIDDRHSMAEKKRERGNFLFTRSDFAGAINSYNKAIKILESGSLQGTPEKLQSLADCRLKCCNNMAACQLKVEAYDAAIKSCQSVLDLQPENVKALFRLGKAFTAKGDTKAGIQYLQKALNLEPDSKVIKQEIRKLSQKLSKETELEKDMYKKMLGTKTTASAPIKTYSQQKSWKWTFAGGLVAALVAAGLAAYRYGHH